MVKNIALAAIVGLFATATLAAPTGGDAATGHNPSEKDAKAGTDTTSADTTKKEEPKKEEDKK